MYKHISKVYMWKEVYSHITLGGVQSVGERFHSHPLHRNWTLKSKKCAFITIYVAYPYQSMIAKPKSTAIFKHYKSQKLTITPSLLNGLH